MDGTLYTKASWDVLQAVFAEAWGYIAEVAADEPYTPASEPIGAEDGEGGEDAEGIESGEYAEGGELLQPLLAIVDARVQELIVRLTEAMNSLQYAPATVPGGQREITGGVYALADKKTLFVEEIDEDELATAEFKFAGYGLQQIGTLALSLTFNENDVSAHEFALPDELAAVADTMVSEGTPRITVSGENYVTYNIVIYAKQGIKSFSVADGDPLLNVKLTAASNEFRTVSLMLSWLDIAYYDDSYENGEVGIQAKEVVSPSMAHTILDIWSRFDVNRDGKVSILDLNAVRQYLGQTKDPVTGWASPLIERCDLKPDGSIDIEDLTQVMGKYNAGL
jgi:hypothetical protein